MPPNNPKIKTISSAANPIFKALMRLAEDTRFARKEQSALVYGKKFVEEFCEALPENVEAVIATTEQKNSPMAQIILEKKLFSKLDIFGTKHPILKVKTPELGTTEDKSFPAAFSPAVILPLQNPENLGAALRSALAFGVKNIYLTKESAYPFHPRSIRAAGGMAPFLAKFRIFKEDGNSIYSSGNNSVFLLSKEGTPVNQFTFPKNFVLGVGPEGQGLDPALRKQVNTLSIPQEEGVESLNANVALSIALFQQYLRRN